MARGEHRPYHLGSRLRSRLTRPRPSWRPSLLTLVVPTTTAVATTNAAFHCLPSTAPSWHPLCPAASFSSLPKRSWMCAPQSEESWAGAWQAVLPGSGRRKEAQRCVDEAQARALRRRKGYLSLSAPSVDAGTSRARKEDGDPRQSEEWGAFSPAIDAPSNLDGEDTLVSPVLVKVVGVGGGGGNAVDGMITTATRKLAGVEFLAMNTDTQALSRSRAEVKLTLGSDVTRGLGAGGKPEIGKAAARESIPEIEKALAGADMVFVTAGMGGGTGTGAAPVIAAAARALGCVTVAVVTEPFGFEGRQRARQAEAGVEELRQCADTVLVVDNDRLLEIVPGRMTMKDAFLVADDVLRQGVIGTSEIIVRPGLINVDFADVREVVKNSGTALIGIGTGTGKTRAEDAAVGAMCSPLLDFPINEAAGVIFNIVGGLDMSLTEVNAAASIIQANVHPDANIIIGALVDERCGKQVSVTVLATGFGSESAPLQQVASSFDDRNSREVHPTVFARGSGVSSSTGVQRRGADGGYASERSSEGLGDGRGYSQVRQGTKREASTKSKRGLLRKLLGWRG